MLRPSSTFLPHHTIDPLLYKPLSKDLQPHDRILSPAHHVFNQFPKINQQYSFLKPLRPTKKPANYLLLTCILLISVGLYAFKKKKT